MDSPDRNVAKSFPHEVRSRMGRMSIPPLEFSGPASELLPKLASEAKRGAEALALIKQYQRWGFWCSMAAPFVCLFLHVSLLLSTRHYPKELGFLFFIFCTFAIWFWAIKANLDVARRIKGAGPPNELKAAHKVTEALPQDAICHIKVENRLYAIQGPEDDVTIKSTDKSEMTVFCWDIVEIKTELPELGEIRVIVQRRTKKIEKKERVKINNRNRDGGFILNVLSPKPKYREFTMYDLTYGRAFHLGLGHAPDLESALDSLDSSIYRVNSENGRVSIDRCYDEPESKEDPILLSATECVSALEQLLA